MMDVLIDIESGSTFSINVDLWETVLTIKEKIEKSQGIPVSKQTLYFKGKVLQDHVGKFNCTIFFDSRLLLSISSEDNPNQNNDQTEESQQQIDEFVKKQDRSLMSNNDQMLKDAVTGKKITKVMARRINNEYSSRPAYSLVELLAPQTTEQSPPSDSAREVLPVEKKIKPNPMKLTVYVKPYEDDPRIIRVEVNADDNVEELRKELVKMQERGELYLPHQGFYLVDSGILLTESKSFKWNLVLDGHKIEITQRKYS